MISQLLRRDFLRQSLVVGAAAMAGPMARRLAAAEPPGAKMRLGLVTYLWAKDWDLATILRNLESSKVLGFEARTTHAHGIEPSLTADQRKDVKKRLADSPVELVGLGSDERFDHPDPAALARAIEATKAFVKLSHDVGSTGVKVKPDSFHAGVPREKTIEQIGKSLLTVGRFAAEHGQQIRLEVHGQCSPPPIIKQILDVADHPSVAVCWNSNAADLAGEGLKRNFELLAGRFGGTCHIRTLDDQRYPFQELLDLMVRKDYAGWLLMECSTTPPADPVAELAHQRNLFVKMVALAQSRA